MSDVDSDTCLSAYEEVQLKTIWKWKEPTPSIFEWLARKLDWDLSKIEKLVAEVWDQIPDAPENVAEAVAQIREVVMRAATGAISSVNDFAQWSVRPEAIIRDYQKMGFEIDSLTDIHRLDLEHVDRVIGFLDAKYKALALAEGGATGFAGLPGLAVDVPALITISLRCVGEYATYCGFDISRQEERAFALSILGLASSSSDAGKQIMMGQLVRIARDVAAKKTWSDLERHGFVVIVQQIAKALGIRLTKRKLAQIIPIFGAAVGAGYNAYYVGKVADAAFYLYRERLLAERCGPEVIELTVDPAAVSAEDVADFEPDADVLEE